jgi:hypothetical protein
MERISSASVELLDRLSQSPTSSTSSLEKFLSAPLSEEGASVVAIEAALRSSPADERRTRYSEPSLPIASHYFSTADSESSVSSANSFQSGYSQLSIDSRGPRRGRKQWMRLQMKHVAPDLIKQSGDPSSTSSRRPQSPWHGREHLQPSIAVECNTLPPSHGQKAYVPSWPSVDSTMPDDATAPSQVISEKFLFCTWPSCCSHFRFRSDWTRHEEALHYYPYHWVCCREDAQDQNTLQCLVCAGTSHTTSEHCGSCADKDLQARTFFREDQLSQHIKRSHLVSDTPKPKISKELLLAWKTNNPCFLKDYLHCGFCGVVSRSWAQRQDHVFEHLRKGICKSSWWLDRKVEVLVSEAS